MFLKGRQIVPFSKNKIKAFLYLTNLKLSEKPHMTLSFRQNIAQLPINLNPFHTKMIGQNKLGN